MADTKDTRLATSVQKDPNFAVICSFLTKYGTLHGLTDVSFDQLERWIEDTRYGECRVSPTIFIVPTSVLKTLSDRLQSFRRQDMWAKYVYHHHYH